MNGSPPPPRPTRTSEEAVRRLATGSLVAGRYRILELVGVGGMGMVYRALDEQLELPIAIKVLRPDLGRDPLRLERFKQEIVLARQVSHPNVVRTHDLGTDGEIVFLTMDFVPGRSLGALIADEGQLGPERAAGIARQIAAGLAVAHEAGVVHRDLKPANILVDDKDRAAITDFGVARSLGGPGLTVPGTVVGTLDYLSPEQVKGDGVDGRSDLYALGILLYEMLTGRLPFAGGSEAEMLAQRLTGSTRDLRTAGVDVPRALDAIVKRLLQRDPERRYKSAREVLADLDSLHGGAPARRFPLSRRTALVAAGLLLAAAALVFGVRAVRDRIQAAPPAPADTAPAHAVALLPLADETGRADLAWVATGLPEMLAASLAEQRGLRVLDGQQVLRTLENLKLPPGPLDAAEARRLADLLDASRLVTGRVHAAGKRLRVDLSLIEADQPGTPVRPLAEEVGQTEAFRLVDRLGKGVRAWLAVPTAGTGLALSRSPEALSSYAAGSVSLRRGDILAAVAALEKAVASDPGYSAAWVQLARARDALGRRETAREAARRGVETLGPGESRSAYTARAVEARLFGRPEEAERILAELVARYPEDVDAQVELAEAYGEQGSFDRAIPALEAVVRIAPHHPRAWYLLGKYSIQTGRVRRALDEYLTKALIIQNQLGSDEGRAEVLNALGLAYRNLGELDRAAESLEEAADIRRRIGDERGYAVTLRNLARLHMVRGEHAAARRLFVEALTLFQRLGDGTGMADVYNSFGMLAEESGAYEEALGHYQQALRLRLDLGNDLNLAESYGNVGFACYQLGRYEDALVYWSQQLDLAGKSGDPRGAVLATQSLGLLDLARGRWDAAVKSFLDTLGKSRELDMKEATAASFGQLGRLAQYQGRPAAALASFKEALAVLRELDDRRGLAEFILAQAEVEIDLGMEKAAGEHLHEAAALLEGEQNREQQAELERLRGEWHLLRGEPTPAREALRRAVAQAQATGSVAALLDARLSTARADLAAGRRTARAELDRLHAQAEALGHARLRLRAAEAVARAALDAGDAEQARKAARAGLDLVAACGGYSGAWRLYLLRARACESLGERAEAEAERGRAAGEVARLSRDLAPEQRTSLKRTAEVEDLAQPNNEGGRSGRRGTG